MSIPNYLAALANHKGAAVVHAGDMLIPVKIIDIEHEERPALGSKTTFTAMVVDASPLSATELAKSAKAVINSFYGAPTWRDVYRPSTRYNDPTPTELRTVEPVIKTGLPQLDIYAALFAKKADAIAARTPCVVREINYDIENVAFTVTSTAVYWKDGTKTEIVYRAGDPALKEHDLALAFSLKAQGIEKVIFNNPHTIVLWGDKSKTIVKCQEGDVYSPETGLFTCIAKKRLGNKGNFNDVFKKHIPSY